jgi:hypothetical protein
VKGRSARPSGGKTRGAKQDRARNGPSATSYAAGVARRQSKKCTSRWKSRQNVQCEVFTGLATKRSRRCLRVWVAEERSSIPACEGGATGATQGRKAAEKLANPPKPPRRRETAGCSIVRPTGGNSSRAGGAGGTDKIPFERGATSSRMNEARVLEIEAVDGRNRSYASRVRAMHRRKAVCETCALVRGLCGQPPDAAHGQSHG